MCVQCASNVRPMCVQCASNVWPHLWMLESLCFGLPIAIPPPIHTTHPAHQMTTRITVTTVQGSDITTGAGMRSLRCGILVTPKNAAPPTPRTAESFRYVVTSIRYIGAAECNRGWCSSAPGVHPQLNASHLAHQCARGLIFFLLYVVGVPPRPPNRRPRRAAPACDMAKQV